MELAQVIAEDLTKRMKDTLQNGLANHFDRVASDNDPAKNTVLYVYDYRDSTALKGLADADSRVLSLTSIVRSEYTYDVVTERFEEMDKNRTQGIKIHGSANSYDSIPLLLQEISRDSLNIKDYSVNRYSLKYTYFYDLYEKEHAEWEEKMSNIEYETYTEERTYSEMIKPPVYAYTDVQYINGEMKKPQRYLVTPGEYEKKTHTVELKRPKGKAPKEPTLKFDAEEIYTPSSLDLIDEAIAKVSSLRSYFGATQNRLEHAYANNSNTEENTQAAESQIRDTDMAEEMVNYSKHSILEQAGQSMLAQANQMTQGVMSLLQA